MFKTMPLPGCIKRFPAVGAGHVLASIPTARLCFFRAAPTGTTDLDSNIEEERKSYALVKYVEPVMESFWMRALVERITPAVLEKATVDEIVEDVARGKATGSLDIHVEGQADRDTRATYGPEVFHALFYPPSFLHAVVEDFRAQAREALVQSIFCPVVEPVLAPVPADFILSLVDEAVSCRPVVPQTVSPIPSSINEQPSSPSPSYSEASILSAIITPPSSPSSSTSSSSSSPSPSTPSSTSTASFEDTPISTKNTEHTYLATPSPTPPRTQERSRPRILMPFVNRLVEQHQHANARIPLSGQAVAATPSPPLRHKKNDNNSPRTPAPAHLSNTPQRPSMLATPPPTPSPASSQCATPAGHGRGNAARGGMEKHWRKRRPKKASASPLRDNVYATPSATPARSKPSAQ